jgi:hypothetical protein
MPKLSKPSFKAFRRVPWLVLAQAAVAANRHWSALSERERERLKKLLADSRGRPGNLNVKQRLELRRLVGKLDLKELGRDALPLLGRSKRGRRK